jgi:hypothetical protein
LAATGVRKATGVFIDAAAARITISELGAPWLASQTHLKPSSYAVVEVAWRIHVEPKWGRRILRDIRYREVQTWVSELSKKKSTTVVIRSYGVMAGMIDIAVRDRRLPSNPARGVNLPRKKGKGAALPQSRPGSVARRRVAIEWDACLVPRVHRIALGFWRRVKQRMSF